MPFDFDSHLIASNLTAAAKRKDVDLDQDTLDGMLVDIVFVTTIDGASSLEVSLADPDLDLLTSGFFDANDDFALDAIDLNYPNGSNWWWRLATVDFTTDPATANVTCTFENRIVSYLRHKRGAKSASRAKVTRAQFIKQITSSEIAHPPKPVFMSPELRVKQPIDPPTVGG